MAAKPVRLQTREFSTQDKATSFFKEMLNRYEDGDALSLEDSRLLFELLCRHPRALEKIGCGVASFSRQKGDKPTSCFHIHRLDDTRTDFSYGTCIRAELPSLQNEFYMACQSAVSDELQAEKAALFRDGGDTSGRLACTETGELVTIHECDYRHTSPKLKEIVEEFLAKYKIALTTELLVPSRDMQYGSEIAVDSIRENFCTYHRQHRRMAIIKRGFRYSGE